MSQSIQFKNLEDILLKLENYDWNNVRINGMWKLENHLLHCSYSIRFSMEGYPKLRSPLFQETIGKMAFNYFKLRGRMQHDTFRLTPGSPVLPTADLPESISHLKSSILSFMDWNEDFSRHEFYGKLSKKNMELAHCLHITNHFQHISM